MNQNHFNCSCNLSCNRKVKFYFFLSRGSDEKKCLKSDSIKCYIIIKQLNNLKIMNFMINQHYGSVDMPSQICDSFQNQGDASEFEDHQNQNSNIKKSRFVQDYRLNTDQSKDDNNFQSSFEDTFLANLPTIPKQNEMKKIAQTVQDPQISLNKTKILKNVLPAQEITEYIQIINSCSHPIVLTVQCPTQIQIINEEAFIKMSDRREGSLIAKDIFLQSWQKYEVGFRIMKSSEELGDIFETISLEYKFANWQGKNIGETKKKRCYIEVEIHYINPKVKLSYQGCSDVKTISLNKVSMNRLAKNKFGQYNMMLGVSSVERFECILQGRGNIKLFPQEVILYKDEMKKITFRNCREQEKGAVVVRAKNGRVQFVFGVQLI